MRNDTIPSINNYKINGVNFVEITNNVGMVTTFTDLGASIHSIKYLNELMTYQAKNIDDYFKSTIYNGKTVGRLVGRIEGSSLKISRKTYKLAANEGSNVLHGGTEGLSTKVFSQRVFNTTEHVHVVYTYFSKAGEAGFPGNALFEVHYIVSNNKPKLKIKLLSYVTEKCPISITNHIYFSLGEPNLDNTKMQINSSKYLELNPKDLIMIGEAEVPSYLDFRKMKPIMKDYYNKALHQGKLDGYDHCYILDKVDENIPQVTLENKKFRVDVYTDFDSTVIYSDNFDLGFEADSSTEKVRRGIAIEPQLNPAKNRILSRGDEFSHFIRFEFAKK